MSKRKLKGVVNRLCVHINNFLQQQRVMDEMSYTERINIRIERDQCGLPVTFEIFVPKQPPVIYEALTEADKLRIRRGRILHRPEIEYILEHGDASNAELRQLLGIALDAPYRLPVHRINSRFKLIKLPRYKVRQIDPKTIGRDLDTRWTIYRTRRV